MTAALASAARRPVAIVGAGPVGLVTALLLKQRGFDPRVFERRSGTSKFPAAHVVNTRTLEVLDEFSVAQRVIEAGAAINSMPYIIWCESLAGREFGRLAMRSADAAGVQRRRDAAAFLPTNIAQNRLEPLLLERLRELGGDVQFNREIVGIAQDDTEVRLSIRDPMSGEESCERFDYVVGCDGASSPVRRAIGLTMEGPRTIARYLTIYFEANLDRDAVSKRAFLFWVGGMDVRGFVISFDHRKTWALLCPVGDHPMTDFTPEVTHGLVRKMIGDPAVPFDIVGTTSWNMSAQVVDHYRHNRVFLAGDAAHRFPPTGGLGMNTGVQDAHNLAWKLAAVLEADADTALLETYESERRPIAVRNSAQSVKNLMRMSEIDAALGFSILAPITPADGLGPLRVRPVPVVGGDAPASRRNENAAVQAAIDAQGEHFDDSLGLELGFYYDSGALIADGTPAPPIDNVNYRPSARPGARLPHLELQPSSGVPQSTLSLIAPRGLTLFSGDAAWLSAAAEFELVLAVGIGPAYAIDDPQRRWQQIFGIDPDGAVLVRPDGHVAWRSRNKPDGSLRAVVAAVIRSIYRTRTDG